jgi:hypothetical protein
MVCAEHNLARADLGHQVPERLRSEHQSVEIELVQYSVGFFFKLISGLQFCGETKHAWSDRGA